MYEFLTQNAFLLGLVLVSGGMLLWSFVQGEPGSIDAGQATLKINREDAVVLDVRNTNEWNSGHIPGARHIALDQLEKRLAELEKFKSHPLVVVCASGNRSANACALLRKAGFAQVFNLSGGLPSWVDAKLPITTK